MLHLALLAISLITAQRGSAAEAVEKDEARHQGIWQAISFVRDGQEAPGEVVSSITRVVEKNHVVWRREGKNFAGTTVVLDPAATPPAIDIQPDGGPSRDKIVRGIYKFDGDTLVICAADPDEERPTSFQAPEGSGWTLQTFRKAAPESQK